jgi:hypothetical protein
MNERSFVGKIGNLGKDQGYIWKYIICEGQDMGVM